MKCDANARRKGEQELALDESGFETVRHDFKDCAMTSADKPWRDDVVTLLRSWKDSP